NSAFNVKLEVQTSENRENKPFGNKWIDPDKMDVNADTSIRPVSGKLYYAYALEENPKDLNYIPIKFSKDNDNHRYSGEVKNVGPYKNVNVNLDVDVKRVPQAGDNYQITVTSPKFS
ncbi:MAG: hypothetical protein C5B43_04070, partial [Verrucomicrobia bacterium]